jgi:hypothetical protein
MHAQEFYSIRAPHGKDKERHMHKLKGVSSYMKIGNKNSNFLCEIQMAKEISLGSMPPDLKLMGITTTAHAVYRSKRWINRRDDFFSGKKGEGERYHHAI